MIAICIGHSRFINGKRDGGAVSLLGMNEWNFNRQLGGTILANLHGKAIPAVMIDEYHGNGYTAAMRWLADELKGRKVKVAIELHFNSADNSTATGHEWLYWHRSIPSKSLAGQLDVEFRAEFPELKARGMKPIDSTARGAEFLRLTHCPAVICEPFFGSNPTDCHTADTRLYDMADAITDALIRWSHHYP